MSIETMIATPVIGEYVKEALARLKPVPEYVYINLVRYKDDSKRDHLRVINNAPVAVTLIQPAKVNEQFRISAIYHPSKGDPFGMPVHVEIPFDQEIFLHPRETYYVPVTKVIGLEQWLNGCPMPADLTVTFGFRTMEGKKARPVTKAIMTIAAHPSAEDVFGLTSSTEG